MQQVGDLSRCKVHSLKLKVLHSSRSSSQFVSVKTEIVYFSENSSFFMQASGLHLAKWFAEALVKKNSFFIC